MKKDDNWQQLDSEALRGDSRPRLTQAGIVIGWLATFRSAMGSSMTVT
jgi:hypothetical protein